MYVCLGWGRGCGLLTGNTCVCVSGVGERVWTVNWEYMCMCVWGGGGGVLTGNTCVCVCVHGGSNNLKCIPKLSD